MSEVRVFLTLLLTYLGASWAYGGPTVKQCEPEFSTFLERFGNIYEVGSTKSGSVDQYQCPVVETKQVLEDRRNWIFVDARVKHEFDAIHIPGSLNVVDATRAIGHLKSQKILLINKGSRRFASLQLCRDMMAKGYSQVSVLENGINGWIASGEAYNGDAAGLRELFLISEQEVTHLLHHDQIQILFIESASNQQAANTLLHQRAHAFSSDQTSEVFQKLSQLNNARDLPVLIVSDGPRNNDIIDRYMTAKNATVYFLANGASSLDRFYQDWKSSLASKNAEDNMGGSCP